MKDGKPAPRKTKNFIGFAKPEKSRLHFFIFPDYETGRAELKASLHRQHIRKTIKEMVYDYVPPSDGNDTEKYIRDLCNETGFSKDFRLDQMDVKQFANLMDGIEKLEGYHQDKDTRKEVWCPITQIQAGNGTQPVEGEQLVVRSEGNETTYTSNAAGLFPPIVHGKKPAELFHKTPHGDLKKLTDLHPETGQRFNLINKFAQYFGATAPVKAPENPIFNKEPFLYKVKEKDTLGRIAGRFKHLGVTVQRIKQDNQLKTDTIYKDQILGINMPPPSVLPAQPAKKAPAPNAAPKNAGNTSASSVMPSAAPKQSATPIAQQETTTPTAPPTPKPGPNNPAPPKGQSNPVKSEAPPKNQAAESAPAVSNTTPARSKEGKGEAIALIKPDDGLVPWMKYAIAEAKRWSGKREADIEKSNNYHKVIQDTKVTMIDTPNAWCAAFANWCLMSAGYPIRNPKEAGYIDQADLSRANGFRKVYVKDKVQDPVVLDAKGKPKKAKTKTHLEVNPLYFKIEEPVYGAIAVATSPHGHGHHVGFVYGRSGKNKICVLGGNQDDAICFAPTTEKEVLETESVKKNGKTVEVKSKSDHLEFYLPVSYAKTYEKSPKTLDDVDFTKLNAEISFVHSKAGALSRTR